MSEDLKRITLDGVELGYGICGSSAAPALVFAHGYAMRGTGALYERLLDVLAETFAVYALDLRGHGASTNVVADWSYEAIADDLAAFAPALGLSQPVLVAHSFGCVVSLLAEIRHPGSFKMLCLLEPGPADSRMDPVDALDAMIEHAGDREGLRDGFAQMFVRDPGAKLEQVLDAAVLVDADVHRAQKEQNPHFSIDDRLKDVCMPTLVLSGKGDSVVEPARQHDLAGKLPRSKGVIFSGEGHMLAVERPAAASREILTFIKQDVAQLCADAPLKAG